MVVKDYKGQRKEIGKQYSVGILFDESSDETKIKYEVSEMGKIKVFFSSPGTYFIRGYSINGQELQLRV